MDDIEKFIDTKLLPDIHFLGNSTDRSNDVYDSLGEQYFELKEENSKLYKKIEELQVICHLSRGRFEGFSDC